MMTIMTQITMMITMTIRAEKYYNDEIMELMKIVTMTMLI